MSGKIICYTGNGEGKTSAAIGHAVRMIGHNKKVVIIQFMKGRKNVGEYVALKNIKNVKFHQARIYLSGLPSFLIKKKDRAKHIKKANEGIELTKKIILGKKCNLLVLDEILYAMKYRLIKENILIGLLKKRGNMHVILTGRSLSRRLYKIADIITEMRRMKHHYKKDKKTVVGIDY